MSTTYRSFSFSVDMLCFGCAEAGPAQHKNGLLGIILCIGLSWRKDSLGLYGTPVASLTLKYSVGSVLSVSLSLSEAGASVSAFGSASPRRFQSVKSPSSRANEKTHILERPAFAIECGPPACTSFYISPTHVQSTRGQPSPPDCACAPPPPP